MKPHMDYVCNAKACRDEHGASPMYDLPVDAKTCPYGHRSIRKVFNAINVMGSKPLQPDFDGRLTSSSKTVIKDTLMRPGFDQADRASQDPRKRLDSFAVHNAQFGAYTGMAGQGRPMTEIERAAVKRRDPHPIHVSNIVGPISRQPIPTTVQGRG